MLKRVMIIAGESSGELYGALLAEKLKARNNGIRILGVGGDRMASSGVELIARIASSFGVTEAIRTFGKIRLTFRNVTATLRSFRPQTLVLIDYPDFNIRVAKVARKLGIKVLYYVSPQVWAWRSGRVKVIKKVVDRMALILPFEADIYREAGGSSEFVGHPAMDEIRDVMKECGTDKSAIRKSLGLVPDRPVMVLMPGSRPHEVGLLFPVMSGVIAAMKKRYPGYQFLIPVAPNLREMPDGQAFLQAGPQSEDIKYLAGQSIKALLAADVAVIASGTSTLQAALLKVPMVVVYRLSRISFFLGKLIIKVNHISLANILLDYLGGSSLRIRELLQDEVSEDNIIMELRKIIDEADYRDEMLLQLERAGKSFMDRAASERVAEMVEELGADSV